MASVVSTELMAYTLAVSGKSQPQLIAFARYQRPTMNGPRERCWQMVTIPPRPPEIEVDGREGEAEEEEEERGPTP